MKKILIIIVVLLFNKTTFAEYDINSCYNDYFNNCPNLFIWKVLSDSKMQSFTTYDMLDNNELKSWIDYEKAIISKWDNNVFLFSWWIETYSSIIVSVYDFFNNKISYLPKKDDILIYNLWWILLDKNNIKDKYFNDFNRDMSYSKDWQTYMWKKEYDFIQNWYSWSFVFNNNLQGYAKIYCDNDKIYLDKEKSVNFVIDFSTKPKVDKDYNMNNLENDLQVLAPCSKFNQVFWLEDNEKEKKIENTKIIEKKSWIEKVIDFIKKFFSSIFSISWLV